MKVFLNSILGIILFSVLFSCNVEKENKTIQNRLAEASSPYLLEHADNPVNWYEWSPEALEKAKKEDKPIIISIGYAACHWCHVMEEESFMDSTVAEIMNKNFVSIKIDREERPDIDKIYMHAAQLLNGSGGWPLNAISLPNGKPFFAGTYFTKPQWKKILRQISQTYRNDKSKITEIAEDLTNDIRRTNGIENVDTADYSSSKENYITLLDNWKKRWDKQNGGYREAQKFPMPVSWSALLQYYYLSGNEEALDMVNTTLNKMVRGGLYDQLGGGFARYTTDEKWMIPHFEKMLYDNAQLISLYSKAYKVSGYEEYQQTIEQSLAFVERELSNDEGGYFSSINADSDGEEGKFYVWSFKEINELLKPSEVDLISDYYNIELNGNWEKQKNILYRRYSANDFSRKRKLSYPEFLSTLNAAKNKLLMARKKRIKPTIDYKILTSWNALMIQAYIDAYTALGNPKFLKKAIKTGNFLRKNTLKADGGLWRSYKHSGKQVSGFLDDYAFLIEAYIDLYQITFDPEWLESAEDLTNYTIKNFRDNTQTLFYYTNHNQSELIVRNVEIDDNVLPSSNSVMAHNLYVLGNLLENKEYLEMSKNMLERVYSEIITNPSYYANWVNLLGRKAFGTYEIAVVGEEAAVKNNLLQNKYLPTAIFLGGESENLPLLKSKLVEGETLIYICQNKTCKYPVSEIQAAFNLLENQQNDFEDKLKLWK
ncbi:thioredoxin domain-containing protein [Gramella sp. AN32]|uniref:Thioredoxin domain-containing protein n=1 Tax=Christiangramia antarctica TaxID=2058158 RepID=A0ABW5X294_9FLAO|nr:thioredoxin domain-containing protein [Gramella sp. AN32]MCM4157038.1 thioredoxin domain-containing protein [Gramella sp. AN32]